MNRLLLGASGLRVTRLGLGLAALGRPGYINLGHSGDLEGGTSVEAMAAHAESVLDAAWQAGIRYFDAARSYGRAEEFLSGWLTRHTINPDEVAVGSKWGYRYTANWRVQADRHEVKEHSLPMLEQQWRESQALLGPWLGLYQVHSATMESGVLHNAAVLAELVRLKERGTAIGLTLSGASQAETLEMAVQSSVDGLPVFDVVQATWNLLEPSAGAALGAAHLAGMGVIVKEALANGRLTGRNQELDFAPRHAILQDQSRRFGVGMDAFALAAALAQPWADVVLSGASTVAQLQSNVGALDVPWDDEAARVTRVLAEAPDLYWQKRAALDWN